jgi:hypothetical protein
VLRNADEVVAGILGAIRQQRAVSGAAQPLHEPLRSGGMGGGFQPAAGAKVCTPLVCSCRMAGLQPETFNNGRMWLLGRRGTAAAGACRSC